MEFKFLENDIKEMKKSLKNAKTIRALSYGLFLIGFLIIQYACLGGGYNVAGHYGSIRNFIQSESEFLNDYKPATESEKVLIEKAARNFYCAVSQLKLFNVAITGLVGFIVISIANIFLFRSISYIRVYNKFLKKYIG